MAIPGLRDGPEALLIPTRVFPRYEAQITGELSGMFKATPVYHLRRAHQSNLWRERRLVGREVLQPLQVRRGQVLSGLEQRQFMIASPHILTVSQ